MNRGWVIFALMLVISAFSSDQQILCLSLISGGVLAGNDQFSTPSWCATQCQSKGGNYPYIALKNGGECYCLLSKPLGLTGTCNVPCKGYGQLNCGGSNSYGIFQIADDNGGSSSQDSSSSSSEVTTSQSSSVSSPSTGNTHSSPSSTTGDKTSQTTQPPSTQDQTSVTTPPPLTFTIVTTAQTLEGKIITVTQTLDLSTPTLASSTLESSSLTTSSSSSKDQKKSTNVGAIVGGVVGGVCGALLIALLVFFFFRYKRNNDDDEDDYDYEGEKFYDNGALGRGVSLKGLKRLKALPLDMPMTNPFEHPLDATATTGGVRPPPLSDPRLNPVMLGRRRLSEGLLVDDADYSRKILHVANPE